MPIPFWYQRKIEHFIRKGFRVGTLDVHFGDGGPLHFEGSVEGPHADITFHDHRAIERILIQGGVGFGSSYTDGLWDTTDLNELCQLAILNFGPDSQFPLREAWWVRMYQRFANSLRKNTRRGAKSNIISHYDLGNDFYRLWLDPTMTYSSALYEYGDVVTDDLEVAQNSKCRRILDQIELTTPQGGTILEIGCGWGGFMEKALDRGFVTTGLTISPSQVAYCAERLREPLREGKATVLDRDYRDEHGSFDAIVSIEMFEALGSQYWSTYFDKIAQCLRFGGRAVIQVIVAHTGELDRYLQRSDFIRQDIFPGGALISDERFIQAARASGLRVVDAFAFGRHYARTLQSWGTRFSFAEDAVRKLQNQFDDRFVRKWFFYLQGCAASFEVGVNDVVQYTLEHA